MLIIQITSIWSFWGNSAKQYQLKIWIFSINNNEKHIANDTDHEISRSFTIFGQGLTF